MYCARCGNEIINEEQMFCEKCGTPVGETKRSSETNNKKNSIPSFEEGMATVTSKINSLAGGQGAVNLHLRDLFSEVFKHHTKEEEDELFICGTSKTTPDIKDIVADWPKPWLYSRVGLVLFMAYALMVLIWKMFMNPNVLPDILFIGSLVMPIMVLVLFFEMNVPRNISFVDMFKTFAVGGALSLIIALILFQIIPGSGTVDIIPAMLTGLIEEVGKALIVVYFINKLKGRKWLLNGIVLGGAVGAGFAVFESAGYALRYGITNGLDMYEAYMQNGYGIENASSEFFPGFYNGMMDNVITRGFLSPGGHVAWAAVSGFAIIYAAEGQNITKDALISPKFLKIFIIPVVLHGIWDSFVVELFPSFSFIHTGCVILIIAIWVVLLVFIDRGLNEINNAINEEKTPELTFDMEKEK